MSLSSPSIMPPTPHWPKDSLTSSTHQPHHHPAYPLLPYHPVNQLDSELDQPHQTSNPTSIRFSAFRLVLECSPSLIFSLLGGILTGQLLQHVQDWSAFLRVPELYILLPVLMNLKGNLEMNLASRLSTSANVGDLDTSVGRKMMVMGNLGLLQVQALIVSLLASILSFALGLLSRNNLPSIKSLPHPKSAINSNSIPTWNHKLQGGYYECLLVLAAGMLAASINCALLGGLMCGLVIGCRTLKLNPDNITTPVASSLGDLLTLVFLSLTASVLIRHAHSGMSTIVFVILACSIILHGYMTKKNKYVQGFLRVGWPPLLIAMMISSCTGLVLEHFVNKLPGFSTIAPVLTGICGNIGTISISRISTSLHSNSSKFRKNHPHAGDTNADNRNSATTPKDSTEFQKIELDDGSEESVDLDHDLFLNPNLDFNHQEPVKKAGLILLLLSNFILGTFAMSSSIFFDHLNEFTINQAIFFVGFMCCATWCSLFSLVSANYVTKFLWNKGLDPDIYAIPLFSSIIDLVGQLSLVLTFKAFRK